MCSKFTILMHKYGICLILAIDRFSYKYLVYHGNFYIEVGKMHLINEQKVGFHHFDLFLNLEY